jgi:GNAT superfamily N-acetyltransferase
LIWRKVANVLGRPEGLRYFCGVDARLTTSTMRPEHIPDGLRLCRAAGWNQTARDWARFLDVTPDGARIAMAAGRVVGTAATIRYGDAFAWIGMVLVDPAVRGRGIGTRLFDEALGLLSDIPVARLDATPAGYPLYLKRGFVAEHRVHRMTNTSAVSRQPVGAGVRAIGPDDLARMLPLDVMAFGAARESTLRWMLEGAPQMAWLADDGSRVRGFVLGRHGHAFDHVGPVIAEDVGTAAALTVAALAVTSRPVVLDATAHVPEWLDWLTSRGFVEQRELIRMTRGTLQVANTDQQFAILGPEFG